MRDEARLLFAHSLAKSTFNVYTTGFNNFKIFLQNFNIPLVLPPPLHVVISYIAYLSMAGYANKSIRSYIEALSFVLKSHSVTDVTKHFLVTKMLTGHKRLVPSQDSRLPITLPILIDLCRVLANICYSNYESLLFKAMFVLAFWALLRVSEIVKTNIKGAEKILQFDDVKVNKKTGIIELKIQWSKTDQCGQGTMISLAQNRALNSSVCPFRALTQFLRVRGKHQGPFFLHFNREPVTRYQFSSVLNAALGALGYQNLRIRAHSFRIGGATFYAQNGMTEDRLKAMGRWRSLSLIHI